MLAPEPIPLFLFAEAREKFGELLAAALADDWLDEAVAALRAFALVDRERIPSVIGRSPSSLIFGRRLPTFLGHSAFVLGMGLHAPLPSFVPPEVDLLALCPGSDK